MREDIALSMRNIFNSPSLEMAETMMKQTIQYFASSAPEFTNWLANNIADGLTCFLFPQA